MKTKKYNNDQNVKKNRSMREFGSPKRVSCFIQKGGSCSSQVARAYSPGRVANATIQYTKGVTFTRKCTEKFNMRLYNPVFTTFHGTVLVFSFVSVSRKQSDCINSHQLCKNGLSNLRENIV